MWQSLVYKTQNIVYKVFTYYVLYVSNVNLAMYLTVLYVPNLGPNGLDVSVPVSRDCVFHTVVH